MNVIYKYPLTGPRTTLNLPIGAQVLTVQMQRDVPVLWALIDQHENITAPRVFLALNTGQSFEIPGTLRYIATAVSSNAIVWHVFEVRL